MAHTIERTFSATTAGPLHRVAAGATQVFRRLARAWESRRALRELGAFDDRMLADVGLNRADLRDALAAPLWSDPTALLTRRRRERKLSRPRRAPAQLSPDIVDAPPLVPEGEACVRAPTCRRGDG